MAASLRYMGSKKSLAPKIASIISRKHGNATVVDAFAGTCAVATALAPTHAVYANDVHQYAATMARALLVTGSKPPNRSDIQTDLFPAYIRNYKALTPAVSKRIALERAAIESTHGRQWRRLFEFTQNELNSEAPIKLKGCRRIDEYRRKPVETPFALFSMLYASTYFGVKQSAEIDSIRAAISSTSEDRQNYYLLALFEAVSHCAAAPGHFAQYFVPRDRYNTHLIARYRRRSVWERFVTAVDDLELPTCYLRSENKVFNLSAQSFLKHALPPIAHNRRLIIYADPPYSRAQYSRYYHVLETLALYDYPIISGKGRYRENRFSTNFSRLGQVLVAMSQFTSAAAETGAELYLSYPTNGLVQMAGGNLEEIIKRYFKRVQVVHSDALSHSTMGGAPGKGALEVTEHIYHASN